MGLDNCRLFKLQFQRHIIFKQGVIRFRTAFEAVPTPVARAKGLHPSEAIKPGPIPILSLRIIIP